MPRNRWCNCKSVTVDHVLQNQSSHTKEIKVTLPTSVTFSINTKSLNPILSLLNPFYPCTWDLDKHMPMFTYKLKWEKYHYGGILISYPVGKQSNLKSKDFFFIQAKGKESSRYFILHVPVQQLTTCPSQSGNNENYRRRASFYHKEHY